MFDSTAQDELSPPAVHVRWFQVDVPELLSIAPIILSSVPTWRPLTREESDACESAWRALPAESAASAASSRSTGTRPADVTVVPKCTYPHCKYEETIELGYVFRY